MTDAESEARCILTAFIYPLRCADMTPEQSEAFENAVELQKNYTGSGTVVSEKVGDVSVTYAGKKAPSSCGHAVAPAAYAVLSAAGLIVRWI